MAIDKMIPRFLVSDEDERLLKEGAMTDALNVTISEDGDGSEGVLKNVKGTTEAFAQAGSELGNQNVVVIAHASDPQRGFIYYFVSDIGSAFEHAIYQYNAKSYVNGGLAPDTYRLVIKGNFLDFVPRPGSITASVLNFMPAHRTELETILYFTNPTQPPRKINVDRAQSGDYDGLSNSDLDYAINCIKAAPTTPPTARFEQDASIVSNNFKYNLFQFACQIIYKDGEESAIGSYSKLAVPRPSVYGGLQQAGYGIVDYIDNVCVINHEIDNNLPDIARVRIIARNGNDGAFFIVDEFDPKESINREINGSLVEVYDPSSRDYRFYNDRLGAGISVDLVDKLYDNVPQKAEGLTIIDNRLMMSNYMEGYPNVDLGASTLDVRYGAEGEAASGGLIDSAEATFVVAPSGTFDVDVDITAASDISSGDTIPGGSRFHFSFSFAPTFTATAATGNLISINVRDTSNNQAPGTLTATSVTFSPAPVNPEVYNFTYRTPTDFTTAQFANQIQGLIEGKKLTLTYDMSNLSLTTNNIQNTTSALFSGSFVVDFKFGEVIGATGDVIKLKARLSNIRVISSNGSYSVTPSNIEVSRTDNALAIEGAVQSESIYTSVSSYVQDQVATLVESDVKRGFKSGATHNFGVVFYDKFNRSGFVNELGGVFVSHIGPRGNGKGPASISIQKEWLAPFWAESYQVVYSGSSIQDFTQYTTGGAYAKLKAGTSLVDSKAKLIYVSLKTLDLHRKDKEILKDYSFTKGDKLRVISYDDTSLNPVYVRGSGGTVSNKVIEFDVVGVQILGDTSDNPISGQAAGAVADEHQGTFLVLEAPQIVSTSSLTINSDVNKYIGFDWYHVSGTDYNSSVALGTYGGTNFWNQNALVEIVTPRKSTSESIYYEIGERFSADTPVKLIKLDGGDVYYRPVSCKSVTYNSSSSTWEADDPPAWEYRVKFLEDFSVSDSFASKSWDKGRPHVKFDNADTVVYQNGITYSQKYVVGSSSLPLSSFDTNLSNFSEVDLKYGALRFIGNYNDELLAIQENKLSLMTVSKNVIEYADGSSNLAISNAILGLPRYSSGDYGCGDHPEAVLVQDNSVYFVDQSRSAVLGLIGSKLTPISDKGMTSYFRGFFSHGHINYISGFDPRYNTYYLTGWGGTDNDQYKTIGYDTARGVWQSRYSFQPDLYANQNNTLYSAKYTTENNIFWKHNSTSHNNFYGADYPSTVQVVSKLSPSNVKVFNAISYEGDSGANWDMSPVETDLGQTSGTITTWEKKEGSYYSSMPRDGSANSTSNKLYVGDFVSVDQATLTLSGIRLSRVPIPIGATIQYENDDGNLINLGVGGASVTVNSVDSNTQITLSGISTLDVPDKKVFVVLDSATNGDVMRGHYAKIKLTNNSNAKHELYCINTHITDSKSHHPLGQ